MTIMCALDDPFPKKMFGTIGFQLGDGIRYLESEAQNTVLSLEVEFVKSIAGSIPLKCNLSAFSWYISALLRS